MNIEFLNKNLLEAEQLNMSFSFSDQNLENSYRDETRKQRSSVRFYLFIFLSSIFSFIPIYGFFVLHTPSPLGVTMRKIELLLMLPSSLIGVFVNHKFNEHKISTITSYSILFLIIACILSIMYLGDTHHFPIPVSFICLTILILSIMGGFQTAPTLVLAISSYLSVTAFELMFDTSEFRWSFLIILVFLLTNIAHEVILNSILRKTWLQTKINNLLLTTDHLTGLLNRASFQNMSETIFKQAIREKVPVSFLFIDLDFFKKVNDWYGHDYGDEVLNCIGKILTQFALRPLDLKVRYGGEELLLFFYNLSNVQAFEIATTIKNTIFNAKMQNKGSQYGVVTVSIGTCSGVPKQMEDYKLFLKKADVALYQAKMAGRNRVIMG